MSISSTLAVTSLVGFAIQQTLQIVDPLVEWWCKKGKPWNKKATMGVLAFLLGLLVAYECKLDLLVFLGVASYPFGYVVSAVVLSAGTEGANTIQKYLGYVKEAKAAPQVAVSILPSTTSLRVGDTANLMAAVNGNDTKVDWSVANPLLGDVSPDGRFNAKAAGTCNVFARSRANPAIVGTAIIDIH